MTETHIEARRSNRSIEVLGLEALLLLAFAVRIYFTGFPRVVWGDEPFYLWLGQSLWSGHGYDIFGYSGAHFPPLFPILAGGLARLTGDLQQASNWIYVLCGGLLALPIYGIARRIYGQRAAWAAGLVTAVYPALTAGVLAWGTMTEPLYLLCVAAGLHALVNGLEAGRWRDYLLMMLAFGLAYLTRTEALILVVVSLPLLVLVRLLYRDGLGRVLARGGTALVLFLLLAAPYVLYLHRNTGGWRLTGAAGMAYVSMKGLAEDSTAAFDAATWGLDPESGEVYLFSPSSEEEGLVSAMLADPAGFLTRLRANTKDLLTRLFSGRLVPWPVAALAVLGLFSYAWDARRLRDELALVGSLAAPLSYLPFFVQERYLAGGLIPVMVWVGLGCAYLGDWLVTTWQMIWDRQNYDDEDIVQLEEGLAGKSAETGDVSDKAISWEAGEYYDTNDASYDDYPGGGSIRRALAASLPALLVALGLTWHGPRLWQAMQITNSFQPGHVGAAALLPDYGATAESVVMSRYPAVAFHAGSRWEPMPAADWPAILAYRQEHPFDFLVIDEWSVRLRPQLEDLLEPGQAPPELQHLATLDGEAGRVLIYGWKQGDQQTREPP